jgi:hypothetical protein
MTENDINSIFNKVKAVTQRAADATARQAKLARLRISLMTLHSGRNQHLQNIGSWLFSFHKQDKKFDQSVFTEELKSEIAAIEEIDRQVEAIEAQIQAQQQEKDTVEVKDTTPQ